jgi:ribonuclease P protein component
LRAVKKRIRSNQRIGSRKEISFLLDQGKTWRCPQFTICFKVNALAYDRFAVLVSRHMGNAVRRNYIKRYYRELFRANQSENPPFFDILIRPKPVEQIKRIEAAGYYLQWKQAKT